MAGSSGVQTQRLEVADPKRLLPAATSQNDTISHLALAQDPYELLGQTILFEVKIEGNIGVACQGQRIAKERSGQVCALLVCEHQFAIRAAATNIDFDHVAVQSDRLGNLRQRVVTKPGAVAAMCDVQVRTHTPSVALSHGNTEEIHRIEISPQQGKSMIFKPTRGLEPRTTRLQGESSTS